MGSKTYYDVKGSAEYAGVSRRTIYVWINKGVRAVDGVRIWLPVRIVDGVTQINEIDLDNYLDALGYESDEDESNEDDSAEG
ncbi:unnamed protein product [marine sediment metagenome]|uniref:Helix-turn-helix domain-containing protein n=1 Tax=marine sediment metagenome TaxID=412755 RepID=X1LXY4_9ZZZZ